MAEGLLEYVEAQIVAKNLPTTGTYYSDPVLIAGCKWIETAVASTAPVDAAHTPTLATTVETSLDGITYATLHTHTAATTSAVAYNTKSSNRLSSTPAILGKWARFKWVEGSASAQPDYTVTASLIAGS